MLGIDAIAGELENPFGDDANDLDYNGTLAAFERQLLTVLEQVGDEQAKDAFVWVKAGPDDLPSCKDLQDRYLALRARVIEHDRYSALPSQMLDEELLTLLRERERLAQEALEDEEEE